MGLEKLGLTNETLVKSMGAFGGGIASTGRVCGALLGGVALISSLYSRGNLQEQDDPRMWRLSYKLSKKFDQITQHHEGTNCKDIARLDWKDRDAVKDFYNNPDSRRKNCIQVVGETAYILGEILEQRDAK